VTIPYATLLGLREEPGAAAPVLVLPFGNDVVGRPGFVHGGAIGGLLEMAAVAALEAALAADGAAEARFKPISLSVDFMRGGREKETRAQGRVSRLGRRVANVEAVAWQDDAERPIAAARTNYLILR
jgi:uncharacterized protein (TIGR00369 family)